MTTTAEALSGPWVANFQGWLWTGIAASIIVVTQELPTGFPNPGWVAMSAIAQLAVASIWAGAVAGFSRRRYGRVVPVAVGLLWVGIGVARGVVGGVIAAVAGADPEWFYRIGFWTLVSLAWMPLLTYALARWDEHRQLLGARADLAVALGDAQRRAAESADDRAHRIAAAVDDGLAPALDEIRAGLRESAGSMDADAVAAIRVRLDGLADRAANFTAPLASAPPLPRMRRVKMRAAVRDFEVRRPVFAAFLAALDSAPLILPDAFRVGGWGNVGEVALAIVVSAVVLIGAYALLGAIGVQNSLVSALGVLVSGLAGSGVLALLPRDSFDARDAVVLAVFPLVFVTAAFATQTAVALDATNVELVARTTTDRSIIAEVDDRVRSAHEAASAQLETLVRGEVNGRLAGCAMALGFLATGGVAPEARRDVIDGVVAQLDIAASELRAA